MCLDLKTKIASIVLSCKSIEQLVVTKHWIQDMPLDKHDQEQFDLIIRSREARLVAVAKECELL